MKRKETGVLAPHQVIDRIHLVRGQFVLLDRELAELYGLETRVLKQAVRRNPDRFPEDFMFELTKEEFEIWRSQSVISKSDQKGWRYAPMVFTEHGVLMLSSVLKSQKAVEMNISIMRIFIKMRQMISSHKDILTKILEMERQIGSQNDQLSSLFKAVKGLIKEREARTEQDERRRIGFSIKGKI